MPADGEHSQSGERPESERQDLGPAVRIAAERVAAGLSGHPLAVMPAGPPPQQDPAVTDLLQCSPPSSRSGPSFVLPLRRPILFQPPPLLPPPDVFPLRIACTPIVTKTADGTLIPGWIPYFGLDATFAQTWNLTKVTIGDLASTMALAPGEQLTLEFQSSQRKVLEQSTLESTESLSSTESTTADKEAINIARSASKTEGWHVDTTGTLTCGYASLSVTGGYSQSVTEANQQAVNHIHDKTQHSARSLKALHKIEVRGVSEGIVQDRMTRTITNPYYDRTVTLNVFHLLKHFSVQTALSEQRYAIVLRIDGLGFDRDFVLRNTDFLRTNLLDSSLLNDLPVAVQGAKQPLESTALYSAIDTAQLALAYLFSPPFDDRAPNMFNMPPIRDENGNLVSQNEPRTSFEISLQHDAVGDTPGRFQDSGFGRANEHNCAVLLTTLGFFYKLIQESVPDPKDPSSQINILKADDNAVRICTALAASVGDLWNKLFPDPLNSNQLKELVDAHRFTEVIRRVPGFLAMVSGMLQPLLDPAKAEQAALSDYAQAQFVLQHLLEHLECNRNYYVQRYLRYIAETTANQAIIDLAKDALDALVAQKALPKVLQKDPPVQVTIGDFDVDRTFIDKREVIIPGFLPLTNQQVAVVVRELLEEGKTDPPLPAVDPDLEVACDGIYLEVAEGACVLQGVPPRPQLGGSVAVKDLEVSLGGQAHSAGG